ncbi:MAG TPA: glycosyltransferase [Thermoanaerobaculia bacterium]
MSDPRVTVVIATYNWSAALRFSIESVLRQRFRDFELLVIGDGCTDDSAEIVASFADPRVRWHNLPRNTGSQSGPNNAGLELARGEYVAYLGHDDLWHPTHLASLVEALDATGADLAYAVAILYGPPGSGVRSVTGLTHPGNGGPMRFFPPSSAMHRRDLAARIGPWKDHRTIRMPHDYEFFLRAWEHRRSFALTHRVSVFKFTAAWRPDAYRIRSTGEQAEHLRRMESEPDFLERELLDVVAAYAAGRAVDVGTPPDAPPGELVERTKAFKGVETELPPEARTDRLRFDFDQVLPGLEWHGVERDPRHGTLQWSGPGTRSSLHLPLANDRDLEIELQVVHALAPDVLDSLRLAVNGEPVALERRAGESGANRFRGLIPAAALARSAGPPRLTFEVGRTIAPVEIDPASGDRRRLGLAFNWIEVRPVKD